MRVAMGLAVMLGCGTRTGERPEAVTTTPVVTPTPVTSNVVETPVSAAAAEEAAPGEPAGLIGWWRGDGVCIELFASGDFELSIIGREPKVMVIGAATVTADGDGFALSLRVARIWRARYTGPCRRVHELGSWIDEQQELGVTFKAGATATLKLRRRGEAQVELCGETCATLTRATPALGGRWRRPDFDLPAAEQPRRAAGDLLELEVNGHMSHVWSALADGKHGTAYGQGEARSLGADRFTVTFAAERYADVAEGVVPALFGAPLAVGAAVVVDARRLAGERLEVCDAARRCATLERQFDAYDHELR